MVVVIVKIGMAMEYLTQVTGVIITQTTDAIKKEIIIQQHQQHRINSNLLLLIGQGTRQDRDGDYRSNVQLMS